MEILDVVVSIFVGIVSIVSLVVLYLLSKWSYWERLNFPARSKWEMLKVFSRIHKLSFHDFDMESQKRFGKVYGTYFGITPMLMISDANILKNVMVKEFHKFQNRRPVNTGVEMIDKMMSIVEGEDWKRIRSVVSPTFTTGKIRKMTTLVKQCSETLIQNVKTITEKDDPKIEMKSYAGAFSMDVIASCAFGTKIDSHQDPENPFVQNAKKVFSGKIGFKLIIGLLFPGIWKTFGMTALPSDAGHWFFERITRQIMKLRKEMKDKPNDFLQLLLDAQTGKGDAENATDEDNLAHYQVGGESHDIFQTKGKSKYISETEIIAQCVLFFLAGYDTTGSTISYTVYTMATNPEYQEKLHQEIDETFGNKENLELEDVERMEYLNKVISETLRMYPPAIRIERKAEEDYEIPEYGVKLRKGDILAIPAYAMHHDPELYPDPETFDPERFSPENKAKRNPYHYLPFGAGPRNCVGMRFALMEVKMALVYLFRNFRFYRIPETRVPLEFKYGFGLLTPLDVTVGVATRNQK